MKNRAPEALPMKQPNLLPNPLLRQNRRPAKLHLPKSLAAPNTGSSPGAPKPLSAMSVREKMLLGISMELNRLQENPASFDQMFPPTAAAHAATKTGSKRVRESAEKLLHKLRPGGSDGDVEGEEHEARRFERKMRSVWVQTSLTARDTGMLTHGKHRRKHSYRLQLELQLSKCDQLPFEKLPAASVFSQRVRRTRAKASQAPSTLSREL